MATADTRRKLPIDICRRLYTEFTKGHPQRQAFHKKTRWSESCLTGLLRDDFKNRVSAVSFRR